MDVRSRVSSSMTHFAEQTLRARKLPRPGASRDPLGKGLTGAAAHRWQHASARRAFEIICAIGQGYVKSSSEPRAVGRPTLNGQGH